MVVGGCVTVVVDELGHKAAKVRIGGHVCVWHPFISMDRLTPSGGGV